MAKWRQRDGDSDRFQKVGKIRRRDRRTPRSADLQEKFESDEEDWQLGGENQAFAARVVEVHKRYCFVSTEEKRGKVNTKDVWLATIARKFLVAERAERNFVAVGDRVLCTPAPDQVVEDDYDLPRCVVQNMSRRQSKLSRLDPHRDSLEHVLATNMDQLLIVASYRNPSVKWGLIDRYLVLAEGEGLPVVIVLNKRDLLVEETPEFLARTEEMLATYRSLGYEVMEIQANAEGADADPAVVKLRQLLDKKITLLSGHSGVGKSSLINLFDPEIVQAVEPDANIFYKGRHTTTYASFIKLGTGGYVIDTPGIRSFTFANMSSIELSHRFVEMRPMLGQCKYRECRHIDEPDCRVREAVEAGQISRWRYRSYLGILLGATGREGRIRDLPLESDDEE